MDAAAFGAELAARGLGGVAPFLTERAAALLLRVQRHSEAVFTPYYNELVPLALAGDAHEAAMNVD
ncbi:hypothetical protein JKP88DRAFT_225360 [Tribonema minus]|uniref:Uncharacterized protein n=1 Tax=Tribonema minus TaxID=303371 RepID=A0A835YNA3_9STRA|nr:hypothetical protein JKP88DRAFT_225360 [Tribonema minus]